ncbi:MAG: cytochrome c biogenesis protein CcdA [Actinobacteria bacterium]|nr:cytochrome c biogenesis protein CcdA [Actinomycetota bacterium]
MLEVGIISAFIAGILSFISPCVLPLVPVYLGIMSRNTIYKSEKIKLSDRLYSFFNSLLFVAGFSIVFIILGSTATLFGQLMKNYLGIIGRIGGAILIIFGLHYVGLFKIPFLNMEKRLKMPEKLRTGYLWSFLFGVIFSFGWVPCVGMILSAILLLASNMETLAQGITLLLIFSAGLGLPFILASLFVGFSSRFLKKINRHLNIISIISGVFLIALGIIFVTDSMLKIMNFLLSRLPFLSKISFY